MSIKTKKQFIYIAKKIKMQLYPSVYLYISFLMFHLS